jgi:hypothetical protein
MTGPTDHPDRTTAETGEIGEIGETGEIDGSPKMTISKVIV